MRAETRETDVEELHRWASDPTSWRSDAPIVAVVDLDMANSPAGGPRAPSLGDQRGAVGGRPLPFGMPAVVVGVAADAASRPEICDLVLGADERDHIDLVLDTVGTNPVASMALVSLMRTERERGVAAGLVAESATYAALQAGEEFRRWRTGRPPSPVKSDEQPVIARREGDVLHLRLHRPSRRNALDASMRDALAEMLGLVAADRTIRSVVLDGAGPAFCSGGDLDEFGTAPDPAVAHLVRLERNLGALLHDVAERLTVHVHGAAVGSGIEMAAFAGRVLMAPDVRIALPELSMGLIPGAGGTVSIAARIGRHRLCRLALTGEQIGVRAALDWGLADGMLD